MIPCRQFFLAIGERQYTVSRLPERTPIAKASFQTLVVGSHIQECLALDGVLQ